jgi:hypothetical protein
MSQQQETERRGSLLKGRHHVSPEFVLKQARPDRLAPCAARQADYCPSFVPMDVCPFRVVPYGMTRVSPL